MNYFLAFVLGYVFGNFPPGYLGVKFIKKADIRDFGSGNIGMVNVNRVLGTRWALVALLLDTLKGFAAVKVGSMIGGEMGEMMCGMLGGLGAVVGHNWPAVLRFKGGKGVAATSGVVLALSPPAYGVSMAIYILVVAIWRYGSLGSMIAGAVVPLAFFLFGRSTNEILFGVVLALFILARHHANIRRLLTGNESKLGFKPAEKISPEEDSEEALEK